jgi:hypothetical protein
VFGTSERGSDIMTHTPDPNRPTGWHGPTGWHIAEAFPPALLAYRVDGITRFLVNVDPDETAPFPYTLTAHAGPDVDRLYFDTLGEAVALVQSLERSWERERVRTLTAGISTPERATSPETTQPAFDRAIAAIVGAS